MKIHRLNNKEKIYELLKDAADKLLAGTKSVTLSLDALATLPTPKDADRPKITITDTAYLKIKTLVEQCSDEIAWHGVVSNPQPKHYVIEDVLVYPQIVSKATVESDDDYYPEWLDSLDDDTFNAIRMQGHSHVNMTVTPSGTDTNFYETIINHISDYYIFMIVNKQGKMWINLYDINDNVIYETKDIDIEHQGTELIEWYEKEYALHVSERSYSYGRSGVITIGGSTTGSYLDKYYDSIAKDIKTVKPNKNKKGAKKNGLK